MQYFTSRASKKIIYHFILQSDHGYGPFGFPTIHPEPMETSFYLNCQEYEQLANHEDATKHVISLRTTVPEFIQ